MANPARIDHSRTSAGLRALATAVQSQRVHVSDGAVRVHTDERHNQILRIIPALTNTTTTEWVGDSGWQYRTTTGSLLGLTVAVTVLLDGPPAGDVTPKP